LVSATPSLGWMFFVFVHGMLESNGKRKWVLGLCMCRLRFSLSEHIMLSWSKNDNKLTLPSLRTRLCNASLHFDPSTMYETSTLSTYDPSSHFLVIYVVMLMVAYVPSWRWHGNGRLPLDRWKQATLLFSILLCRIDVAHHKILE